MSTRVGTLQGSRAKESGGRSIWPAAILASLVMLTIAVAAVSLSRDQAEPNPKPAVSEIEETFVGGTAANTPSELRGGIAGGIEETFVGGTAANTPRGRVAPRFPDGTAQDEPIMVNGHICGQCG